MFNYRKIEQRLRTSPQEDTPLEYSLRYHLQHSKLKHNTHATDPCELESEGEADSDHEDPSDYITPVTPAPTSPTPTPLRTPPNIPPFQTRQWEDDICFDDSDNEHNNNPLLDENQPPHHRRPKRPTPTNLTHTIASIAQLNTRLTQSTWEDQVIWDIEALDPRTAKARASTPIRLPRDDPELILNRKTTGFHHVVDDVAKQIQDALHQRSHAQHHAQQLRMPLQQWLGFRGGPFQGVVPVKGSGGSWMDQKHRHRAAAASAAAAVSRTKTIEVVPHSFVATKHVLLHTQPSLTYTANGLSSHRPLLMTYCVESKANTRRKRYVDMFCFFFFVAPVVPQWFCHNGFATMVLPQWFDTDGCCSSSSFLLFFVLVVFKEPMFGNVDGSNTNVLPRKNVHGTGV